MHAPCWSTHQSLWCADPSLETVLALSLWISSPLQTWPSLLTMSFGAGILRPQLCIVLSCKYFNIWIQIFGIQLAKSQPCIRSPRTVILGSTQLQLPKRGCGRKVKSVPMSRFTMSSKLPPALSMTAWFSFFTSDSSTLPSPGPFYHLVQTLPMLHAAVAQMPRELFNPLLPRAAFCLDGPI